MTADAPSWLYAVVPGTINEPPAGTTGVTEEPVRLLPAGELAAVVGTVDIEQGGAERLSRRLQDPAWLERAVRRHHRVVTALFRAVPTVPFRLATVYHDDQRVTNLLCERSAELLTALATVTGRAEWGVQGYAIPDPISDTSAPPPSPSPARAVTGAANQTATQQPRPGTEYLLRRRAERSRQQQARAAAQSAAQQIDTALTTLAVAAHRPSMNGRPADPEQPGTLVFNASYLVDEGDADRFQYTIQQLADELPQLRLRLTGPWPAYSFVEVEVESP